MTTDKQLAALHKALTAIPDEDRDYAARFVKANAHKEPEELLAHWQQDRADRAKAADIERHRKERVMSEFLDTYGKDAIAALSGVASDAESGKAKGE